jgi:hypothetical protein
MNTSKSAAPNMLEELSPALASALAAANYRLRQQLSPADVVSALVLSHRSETAVMLQPGYSGYSWSTRTVPLVFVAPLDEIMVVRVRRGFNYRNQGCSPSCWPELRGFPLGNMGHKLQKWASHEDSVRIPRLALAALEMAEMQAHLTQWLIQTP